MVSSRPARSVAILFSERDRPEHYVISKLAQHWREDGLRVAYLFGTRRFVPADLLIVHVDLSVVPQHIVEFADRYPRVLNHHVRDIRKRTFSTLSLGRESEHAGSVIVKTNLNCGGAPERSNHPSRLLRMYHHARHCYFRVLTGSWSYRVYPSLGEVPAACFDDPDLLVERFLPERSGTDFVVRTYHCFGERDSFFLLAAPHPIVKSGPATRTVALAPDPRLQTLRRALKLDYGKIDYVLADGEPVVFDINKTIGLTPQFARDPNVERARRERARAIYDYLP
jgi:hypothetical protein